jgi:hypothetical protein
MFKDKFLRDYEAIQESERKKEEEEFKMGGRYGTAKFNRNSHKEKKKVQFQNRNPRKLSVYKDMMRTYCQMYNSQVPPSDDDVKTGKKEEEIN